MNGYKKGRKFISATLGALLELSSKEGVCPINTASLLKIEESGLCFGPDMTGLLVFPDKLDTNKLITIGFEIANNGVINYQARTKAAARLSKGEFVLFTKDVETLERILEVPNDTPINPSENQTQTRQEDTDWREKYWQLRSALRYGLLRSKEYKDAPDLAELAIEIFTHDTPEERTNSAHQFFDKLAQSTNTSPKDQESFDKRLKDVKAYYEATLADELRKIRTQHQGDLLYLANVTALAKEASEKGNSLVAERLAQITKALDEAPKRPIVSVTSFPNTVPGWANLDRKKLKISQTSAEGKQDVGA